MRVPDLDRINSEKKLTLSEFLASYNEGLPQEFPKATEGILTEFKEKYPELFKGGSSWSLDQHRKRLMDWLPAHVRASQSL